jgi:hypothetical protein
VPSGRGSRTRGQAPAHPCSSRSAQAADSRNTVGSPVRSGRTWGPSRTAGRSRVRRHHRCPSEPGSTPPARLCGLSWFDLNRYCRCGSRRSSARCQPDVCQVSAGRRRGGAVEFHTACAADRQLDPHRDPITVPELEPGVSAERITNHEHTIVVPLDLCWIHHRQGSHERSLERARRATRPPPSRPGTRPCRRRPSCATPTPSGSGPNSPVATPSLAADRPGRSGRLHPGQDGGAAGAPVAGKGVRGADFGSDHPDDHQFTSVHLDDRARPLVPAGHYVDRGER